MVLDIRSALADLETQKADLLETISQLSKTRGDLLLPDKAEKLREEIRALEATRDATIAAIESVKPVAAGIIEGAKRTASKIISDANGESHTIITNAQVAAAELRSQAEALLDNATQSMAAASTRTKEVSDRAEALHGRSAELANRRSKLVPLLRSLAAELEREIS